MNMPSKKGLVVGLLVFATTTLLAIGLNSFVLGYGFQTVRSVSRYVGFEEWSAVMFALGNFVTAGMTMAFLWKLGELWKMPRIYYYIGFLMGIGLIWLSACPVGFFDSVEGKSVISFMHEIASRTMFLMMLLVAVLLAMKKSYATKTSRGLALAFALYGVICVIGYFTRSGWFMPYFMIYEVSYIVAFELLLIAQKSKAPAEIEAE